MQILLLTPAIFLFTIFSLFGQKTGELVAPTKNPDMLKNLPKELKPFYKDMVYIPSGSFVSGYDPTDSARKTITVSVFSFYMSSKEVTNKQYREFYESKLKELGKEKAKEFYPVYNVGEMPYEFNGTFINDSMYLYHPAYDEYPVVGVSWNQANAYCKWLSKKVADVLKTHVGWEQKYLMPEFRLPTEMEWEYAAYGGKSRSLYSFGSTVFDSRKGGAYNGNFGKIKDEKGMEIKSETDDGFFFTGNVKSFLPNGFGLYNMSGNVNEWVFDSFGRELFEFRHDLSHDYRIDEPENENLKNGRVIKGGGFLDTPYYLLVSSRRELNPATGRCDVGFRICMTYYVRDSDGDL